MTSKFFTKTELVDKIHQVDLSYFNTSCVLYEIIGKVIDLTDDGRIEFETIGKCLKNISEMNAVVLNQLRETLMSSLEYADEDPALTDDADEIDNRDY